MNARPQSSERRVIWVGAETIVIVTMVAQEGEIMDFKQLNEHLELKIVLPGMYNL
jgi:hypothetical protein